MKYPNSISSFGGEKEVLNDQEAFAYLSDRMRNLDDAANLLAQVVRMYENNVFLANANKANNPYNVGLWINQSRDVLKRLEKKS